MTEQTRTDLDDAEKHLRNAMKLIETVCSPSSIHGDPSQIRNHFEAELNSALTAFANYIYPFWRQQK